LVLNIVVFVIDNQGALERPNPGPRPLDLLNPTPNHTAIIRKLRIPLIHILPTRRNPTPHSHLRTPLQPINRVIDHLSLLLTTHQKRFLINRTQLRCVGSAPSQAKLLLFEIVVVFHEEVAAALLLLLLGEFFALLGGHVLLFKLLGLLQELLVLVFAFGGGGLGEV
jgi:hypothetical protein